jgi:hypothetical protein
MDDKIMKTIFDAGILKQLAPAVIKDIVILEVISAAIQTHIIDNIKYLVFLDRVCDFSAEECDTAAKELHIDWYDGKMSLAEKRKSCEDSFLLHATFGTPGSVQDVLDIFFSGARLSEWWEYSGTPGHYKIKVDGVIPKNLTSINKKIEHIKKKSQILDEFRFISNIIGKMNTKSGISHGFSIWIKQSEYNMDVDSSAMYTKSGLGSFERGGKINGSI